MLSIEVIIYLYITAGLYSPCILLLQSIHAIGRDRDGSSDGKYTETTPIIVQIKKVSQRKIVNILLSVRFNICFGCSKELSH